MRGEAQAIDIRLRVLPIDLASAPQRKEWIVRRLLVTLVLVAVFAVGVGIGFGTPEANAGKTKCWTTCSNGVAMECCRTGAIVLCRVLADDC